MIQCKRSIVGKAQPTKPNIIYFNVFILLGVAELQYFFHFYFLRSLKLVCFTFFFSRFFFLQSWILFTTLRFPLWYGVRCCCLLPGLIHNENWLNIMWACYAHGFVVFRISSLYAIFVWFCILLYVLCIT